MIIQEINDFLNQFNFDLKITKDARWIDQKCTPDVICFLADCVCNFITENPRNENFTVNDIWESNYFNQNVQSVFGKPSANNPQAGSEYDKFINQPLKMLSYSKILSCKKIGTTNHFTVINLNILEYIATREKNTNQFLILYIEKVFRDSGIYYLFDRFKGKCVLGTVSNTDLNEFKTSYEDFILEYTPINQRVEIRRIFTKIINPLSVEYKINGAIKGRLSKDVITYSELMYNRINWRDTLKSKSLTRQEFETVTQNDEESKTYTNYLIQKAISQVKRRYSTSELHDAWSNGEATQVHHIFMKSEFPQISYYLENLIKLTPTQHYTKAHPNNNTQIINKEYQHICLIAKFNSIQVSIRQNDDFYSIENFIFVLNTGLSEELPKNSSSTDIEKFLAISYNQN